MSIKQNYCSLLLGFAVAAFLLLVSSSAAQALPPANQVSLAAQKSPGATAAQKDTLVIGREQDCPPFATGLVVVFFLAVAGYFFYQRYVERKEAVRKYRDLYDHAPDMFLSVDSQKEIILECNQTLLDSMGYSREELVGHSAFTLYHPDCADLVRAMHQRFLSSKEVHGVELQLRCKDGSKIEVSLSASAVCDAKGNILHSRTVLHDISEHKRLEQSLRKSEESFRNFFEINTSVMLLIDPASGNIMAANAAAVSFYGYPAEQIVGMSISEINAMSPERIAEEGQRSLSEECNFFHFSHRLASGEVRDVEVHLTPIDSGGRPLLFSIIHDITDRMQAEVKLRLAATVFTHAREGILITNADGTIIDVNDTFSHITGYSRDEALGRNPRFLSSGRHQKEFFTALWKSLLEDGHWYGEIWNRRKSGEVFAEMLTISAVRDAQGIVEQYVALFSDITTLKAHEKQLEHIAHYDALTALPNRVLLADRMQQAMAQALRREKRLAVIYLDIDGFKSINDSHGHEAGDQLLMAVARHMKQVLREGDTLARLGGDEFVAVLPDLEDAATSEAMLSRLLAAAAQPVFVGELALDISISLGITFYPQAEETDADHLLRQADQAMYQAKLAGKNCYRFYQA